jgi:hypothetical protein
VTLQVSSRHCYACSPFPRATKNDTSMQRGPDCQSGSQTTAVMSASHDHPSRGSNKSARAATIFIHNDAPQALLDCQAPPLFWLLRRFGRGRRENERESHRERTGIDRGAHSDSMPILAPK